jgi:hypothetical protein
MNAWRWVDPRIEQVNVSGLRAYLLARGWKEVPSGSPALLRFEAAGASNCSLFQMLPAREEFRDFAQSVTYFITTLSEIEDRHPVDVLSDILTHQGSQRRPSGLVSA